MHRATGAPRRVGVRVRQATDADISRIVEIGNAVFPEYRETIEEFQAFEDRLRAGGYTSVHLVAETADGLVVGHGGFRHIPGQFRPTRYQLGVFTHPDWQGRGVGRALYDRALAELIERGGAEIESFARETMPRSIAFLEHRGFREIMRTWETRLDLARFDPAPFAHYPTHVQQSGVTITTLADERRRDAGALRRAYELHNAVVADIPSPIPFTPPSFEDYLRARIESPRALLDAYFLAVLGHRYIGVANLERPAEGTHLYHNVTGVLREFRGRGIGMALKLATVAYAQAHGYSEIRTWNEVHNAGMLAINDRLGFVRQPAWITYEKRIGGIPA